MPNQSLPRLGALSALLLVAMLLVASPVFAKTITVDGNPAEWGQTPVVGPIQTDPSGDAGNVSRDIGPVYAANSTTTLYYRFDTAAVTDWGPNNRVRFCLNTDNTSAGATVTECNGQSGIDYIVTFAGANANPNVSTVNAVLFQNCTSGTCVITTPVPGGIVAARQPNGTVSEFGIPVSLLRQTTANLVSPNSLPPVCTTASPCPIPTVLVFDAPTGLDDTASFTVSIPVTPTPVTLTAFSATRGENGVNLAWSTASELNIQGFHILRSAGGREAATRITPELIPGEGSGVSGGTYRFTDTDAAVGSSYSYWLEVINSDGTPEEYGPARYSPATAAPTLVYLPLVRQ